MTEYGYDPFPSNIAETAGPIPKEGFEFHFSRVVVWQGGQNVAESELGGVALGEVFELMPGFEYLVFNHSHPLLAQIFDAPCTFQQISTNLDRIMWSVNIFSTESGPARQAMILGLLFKAGELSLIKINVDAPVPTQIELFRD